jgi:UDP-N-acetylmuramate--alanine ligase
VAEYTGAGRRFEFRGETRGVRVYDDYAHHPTEIAATIGTARGLGGRVLVLFQPHLYSRTRHLAHELGRALASADAVAVADVYAARERDGDVSGKVVVDAVTDARTATRVAWMPSREDGARWLARRARDGDVILTVGAGDVDAAVPAVLEALA